MLGKTISVTALMLLAALAGSAQENDTAAESTQNPEVAFHGPPDCDYPNRFCVWGALRDATGPNRESPRPMRKGPIDVCAQWDFNCSNPYQTVCQLHGRHGLNPRHWTREGSYFFVLSVNQGWRVKPRVAGDHLSWNPPASVFPAGSVSPGRLQTRSFDLLGTAPDTRLCDF